MNDETTSRKSDARTRFNAAAAEYDAGPGAFAHFGRRLVVVAAIAPGSRVLDVATGRGAVLFPAAEQVGVSGQAIGVDFSDEMVRLTERDAARRGLPVTLQVMDAEHLEFADATFDRVLCGFGIMFFPNQERALGEFHRLMTPEGRLAISTWRVHQANEVEAALTVAGISRPRFPGWITEPDNLAELLTNAGFSNVQVNTDTHSFRYATVEEYWQQARGTGLRPALDALDGVQAERVRSILVERMRPHQRSDGYHLAATALMAVAHC